MSRGLGDVYKRQAEEDRKFRELVDVRNQADGLIHASEKTLAELGEKASSEERQAIESAIADLKSAMESDDKDKIETKTAALTEASGGLAQKLYAEQQASAEGAGEEPGEGSADDDVVDAEFEEVDNKDDSSKG